MIQFVKFDCGCIGSKPDEQGRSVLIESCDRSFDDPKNHVSLSDRCEGKEYTVLTDVENVEQIKIIGRLVSDGQSFRTIRSLLK